MQRVELADIKKTQVAFLPAEEGALVTILQIEINDAEAIRHLTEERENLRRNHMDTRESQLLECGRVESRLRAPHITSLHVRPPIQQLLVVEESVAFGLPATHQQQRIGLMLFGKRIKRGQIDIAEDIDIMDKNRF